MLAELSDELFGVDVVEADRAVVGDGTEHLFHEVRELGLVDCAREVGLGLNHLTLINI